jgi:hypothetical protein
MKLVRTLIERVTTPLVSYTPFPLEHECKGLYVKWERKLFVEFKYEIT